MPRARGKDCRKGCIGGPDPYQEHKLHGPDWWTLCATPIECFHHSAPSDGWLGLGLGLVLSPLAIRSRALVRANAVRRVGVMVGVFRPRALRARERRRARPKTPRIRNGDSERRREEPGGF